MDNPPPPCSVYHTYFLQYGTGAAPADMVVFLDGFEKEQRAVESTLDSFRISWRRPNWHILLQKAPEALLHR